MSAQSLLCKASTFSSEPCSELLHSNSCAQSLLWHFLLIHFSKIFEPFYFTSLFFYPDWAFDSHPDCSQTWPSRFIPGQALWIFSGEHFILTGFFFLLLLKQYDVHICLLLPSRPKRSVTFTGGYFSATLYAHQRCKTDTDKVKMKSAPGEFTLSWQTGRFEVAYLVGKIRDYYQ